MGKNLIGHRNGLIQIWNPSRLLRFELSTTGAEIARLWTLLRIPTADREAFQASFKVRSNSSEYFE